MDKQAKRVSPEDWFALSAAKARYCRTLDTKDWDGFADLMTPDFVMEVEQRTGLRVAEGRDAALALTRGSLETATSAHHVHMPEMAVEGDAAHVTWAMTDRVDCGPGKSSLTGYGHYHETWLRTDEGWKLERMRLTRLHYDFHRTTEG